VHTNAVLEAGGGRRWSPANVEPFSAEAAQALHGRAALAQKVAELRTQLARVLQVLQRSPARAELFVAEGAGELVPVMNPGDGWSQATRHLLPTLRCRAALRRRDLATPDVFPALPEAQYGAIMTAPILDGAALAGLLVVEAADGQPEFTMTELALLEAIASQFALGLQALRLKEVERSQARLRRDMECACRVQRKLMRDSLPADCGVRSHVEYLPAYGVGGDFYGLTRTADGVVGGVIGDVSGKGVSAALVMSRVASDLERAVAAGRSPAAILAAANARLYDVESETFVTATCLRLDPRSRTLTLASAGHPPLVVRRASGEVFLAGRASGTPLGMVASDYEDEVILLEPRDVVLLATDGLSEALDFPSGEAGLPRLVEHVRAAPHDLRAISDRIRAVVEDVHGRGVLDDVTWVALQLDA
jgi:serine phosphatase RsbU (regulator of sigma subunit)